MYTYNYFLQEIFFAQSSDFIKQKSHDLGFRDWPGNISVVNQVISTHIGIFLRKKLMFSSEGDKFSKLSEDLEQSIHRDIRQVSLEEG